MPDLKYLRGGIEGSTSTAQPYLHTARTRSCGSRMSSNISASEFERPVMSKKEFCAGVALTPDQSELTRLRFLCSSSEQSRAEETWICWSFECSDITNDQLGISGETGHGGANLCIY